MTPLVHELASFLTVAAASAYLVWHFSGLGRSVNQAGCSRCDQQLASVPAASRPSRPSRAVRSRKLNVLQ